jgi:hypothetical protein
MPWRSYSRNPNDYIAKDIEAAAKRGMDTFASKFIGKDSERGVIGTKTYFMQLDLPICVELKPALLRRLK